MNSYVRTRLPRFITRSRAFTLIELLVVILIIGILVAVAAPSFLGQVSKAQDSVAQQNLYNVYISGQGAYSANSAYPFVGDPTPNLGCPGDSDVNDTISDSSDCATGENASASLFAYLDDAEPEFIFAEGVDPGNVNQIEVGEPNPQEVYYADQSASGHIFCLVDIKQDNIGGDGVPAGAYHLESDTVPSGCSTTPSPTDPPEINITSAPPAETTSTSATINYDEGGDVTATACTIDGASTACTSGTSSDPDTASLSGLSLGPHVFVAEVAGPGATAPSDTATVDFTVVANSGGPAGSSSASGGCSAPLVLNTSETACVNPLGSTHYVVNDKAPDISDTILNEVNEGESTVPSGDVRFTADIQNFKEGGTYYFEWSKSKDFSHADRTDEPATPHDMDTGEYDSIDYHTDVPDTDFDGDGTYYWRATATSDGLTTTSCIATFTLDTSQPLPGTAVNNIGDNCANLGTGGDPDDSGGGESIATNGGVGGPATPSSYGGNVQDVYGTCAPTDYDPILGYVCSVMAPYTATPATLTSTYGIGDYEVVVPSGESLELGFAGTTDTMYGTNPQLSVIIFDDSGLVEYNAGSGAADTLGGWPTDTLDFPSVGDGVMIVQIENQSGFSGITASIVP